MEVFIPMKKTAQGAGSITLGLDPDGGPPHPPHLSITVAALTCLTPTPADFWGVAITDGKKYDVIIRLRT